jgi:ribosomal protein L9
LSKLFSPFLLARLRGQIFNSLSLSKIQVAKQKSVDLDTKSIMLDKPIDSLGEFDVPLWIDGRELEEKLKVVVKKKAYK